MLSSISPVGEHGRGQRWWLTVTAYTVASVAAGSAMGAGLGLLGGLLLGGTAEAVRLLALAAVALVGLLVDATTGPPSLHRQVDERWLTRYRGWVYGAGFGAQLGTGVVTIIPSTVVYATWAAAVLVADPVAGLLVGATFGAVRAAPLVAAGRIRRVSALRRALARMERARRPVARTVPVAQMAVAVLAIARSGAV